MNNRLTSSPDKVKQMINIAKANTQVLLEKGFTVPTEPHQGLAIFPVSNELQIEYSVDTPIKNITPRRDQTGGIGFGFKVLKSPDTSRVSSKVQDGRRARFINTQVEDNPYIFVTSGFENFVTYNAQLASENMEVRSQAVSVVQRTLTEMLAIDEEKRIIGGNRKALIEIKSVSATANTEVAGELEAGDVNVIAVPLTLYGLDQSSVVEGVRLTHNELNADGSVTPIKGGYGIKKAVAAAVTVEAGDSLDVLIEDTPDSVGYAVFAGAAGSERLVYVGPSNKVNIKAIPVDTQLASALGNTDQSADNLDYDGLIGLAGREGGVVVSLDGEALTAEGVYVEAFEEVIGSVRDRKISPTHMAMSRKTHTAYYKAIAKNVVNVNMGGGELTTSFGGKAPVAYTSSNTARPLEIIIDDYMPDGMIIFFRVGSAPGELRLDGDIMEMVMVEDYNMIMWPDVTRSHQFGIYSTGVLAHKYPASIGVLKNIKI